MPSTIKSKKLWHIEYRPYCLNYFVVFIMCVE